MISEYIITSPARSIINTGVYSILALRQIHSTIYLDDLLSVLNGSVEDAGKDGHWACSRDGDRRALSSLSIQASVLCRGCCQLPAAGQRSLAGCLEMAARWL